MRRHNKKVINALMHCALYLPTTTLSAGWMASAEAQSAINLEEIIVTARRKEEDIQDVPISVTVFNQDTLDQRNVISAADLVKYTPSLNVNTRFGSDQASFAIRGFNQEFRTTASVGVYFADVVAPRGGAVITAGDGAGPGAFFDLQNVQVLKGPQGTLFGRNTTGGAIQIVPVKPTDEFEGYADVSGGNYDLRRVQAVVNVPISDNIRARLGVDDMEREGYINNVTDIGPDHLSDINYTAARASLVMDLSDNLENYTIAQYSNSKNNSTLQGLFVCNPNSALSFFCQPTLNSQGNDYYAVANETENPFSRLKQWQVINTTTWSASDNFTVKNILSYADLEQATQNSNFGTDFEFANLIISFFPSNLVPGLPSNSQTTMVEELQFSGEAMDSQLTWQAGLYYENSRPDGWSALLSNTFMTCNQLGAEASDFACLDLFGQGFAQASLARIEYTNVAAYGEGTYQINDRLRATLGLRYTKDKTEGTNAQITYTGFPNNTFGPATNQTCVISTAQTPDCYQHLESDSDAPTWLIGLDYLPTQDLMLYGKYSRGYRQGSISPFGAEGVQSYDPEKVDAYELGSKWSFAGPVPGFINLALFYNELTDQQIQVGFSSSTNTASITTGIVNAGSSIIQGLELESSFKLLEPLALNISYSYLDAKLDSLDLPAISADSPFDTIIATSAEGSHLTFSPRHTLSSTLNWQLPLPSSLGFASIGLNYSYVDEQLATEGTYGLLPARRLVNANISWNNIAGSNFNLLLFGTNLTDQEYPVNVTGFYDTPSLGMDFRVTGEPRMVGARVKYDF